MSEPDEIKEPIEVTTWRCPICGLASKCRSVAKWCCQVPPDSDPRWDKVRQAAAEPETHPGYDAPDLPVKTSAATPPTVKPPEQGSQP